MEKSKSEQNYVELYNPHVYIIQFKQLFNSRMIMFYTLPTFFSVMF